MLCASAYEISVAIPIFYGWGNRGRGELGVLCTLLHTELPFVINVWGHMTGSMLVRMAGVRGQECCKSHIQASGWPGHGHVDLRFLISWIPLSAGHHTSYILYIFLSNSPCK